MRHTNGKLELFVYYTDIQLNIVSPVTFTYTENNKEPESLCDGDDEDVPRLAPTTNSSSKFSQHKFVAWKFP